MDFRGEQCYNYKFNAPRPQDKIYDESKPLLYNISCQTAYRESEAQTVPWTPPYRILQSKTPEVLTLACLSFHNGLLVTKHDVEILHRLRKRREWDRYLAHIYSPYNEEFRLKVISELEKNEWEFREKEIEDINELRMELAQQQMLEQRIIVQERMDYRMKRARERCEMEKRLKLPKINAECERELRRIHVLHTGKNKFKKCNIIDRFAHLTSDIYVPLAMFGENAAVGHEKLCIDPQPKVVGDIYNALWKGISTTPLSLGNRKYLKKHCCKKVKFYHMPEIMPVNQIEHYDKLRKTVDKALFAPLACALGEIDEEEDEILRNVVLLQSIIKGRAVQSMVLRHMISHRDLAKELKSTIGLNPKDKANKLGLRKAILMGIRDFNIALHKKGKIVGLIDKLEGHIISTMLDYSSKALTRLEDEKRAHLFALAAEKERWGRESAEAGRRQQEEIRQRQHEEIYRQILKMHEITSDVLLEQTVKKQVKDTSEAMATLWIEKHAKDLDDIQDVSVLEEFEKMEFMNKMSSQFLMDEIEKNQIRAELNARTKALRKYAESVIYSNQNELMEVESSCDDQSTHSIMRKICKDQEQTEWDEFYDEILGNTPEVKHVLTGELQKIPLYENPELAKKILEGDQEDETKKKDQSKSENEKDKDLKQKKKEDEKDKSKKIYRENQSSSSLECSTINKSEEEKSKITAESSAEDSSSIYDIMDKKEVKYINKFFSDQASSDIIESSMESSRTSEKEITLKDLKNAEKRRKAYEKEEKEKFFKTMSEKIMEEIMTKANVIAKKIRELVQDSEEWSTNEACADALIQAYKIVSKALLKCSENFSEDALRGNLKNWLETILTEAEKSVFELFNTLNKDKQILKEESKKVREEKKIDDFKNLIEVTCPSLERLPLISDATGEHIFEGPEYWCPEIRYEDDKVEEPEIFEPKVVPETTFTREELKRLRLEGILLEKKLSYLPDEKHLTKPLEVIKSRRGPTEEWQYHTGSDDSN